jgi:hypothetical protein
LLSFIRQKNVKVIFNNLTWNNSVNFCFVILPVGYTDNAMFVLEIVKITYSVLVFPGLETSSLSKLWKLANDWLRERSPEMISYLVTVRSKSEALFSADFNQIEKILDHGVCMYICQYYQRTDCTEMSRKTFKKIFKKKNTISMRINIFHQTIIIQSTHRHQCHWIYAAWILS